jgi:Protein of unknown function (DUF2971)
MFKRAHRLRHLLTLQGNVLIKLIMDDSIRSAAEAGIGSLYHYQDLQPGLHADRLADVLRNHRIYCSNPADFNDPWDCKPYFDPALLDDPANRAATAESFIATQQPGPNADRYENLLRTDLSFLKWAIHKFSEEQANFITTKWALYCLSPDPCLTLMWSHYSRNHKGICLEFGTESAFQGAVEVQYQKEYPPLLLHDKGSHIRMLLTKSDVWSYEKEFRLICSRTTALKNYPLSMVGDSLSLAPNDLKSIILGCQADEETVTTVRTLVNEHAPTVLIRKAKRAPNKYRLIIEG